MRRAESIRSARSGGRLGRLLVLSLTLHGLLFMLLVREQALPPSPRPTLVATLRLPAPLAGAALTAAPAAPVAKARQRAVVAARPVHRQALAAAAIVLPASVPGAAVAASPASAAADVSQAADEAAPATGSETPAAPLVVASPAAARPPGAEAALAGYRQRLAELLARHRSYPRLAAMRGWEGEVRLRLRVARRGALIAVEVEHSSGFELLDRHARSLLVALGDLPPPPSADGGEIQVVVPIQYKLDRTT